MLCIFLSPHSRWKLDRRPTTITLARDENGGSGGWEESCLSRSSRSYTARYVMKASLSRARICVMVDVVFEWVFITLRSRERASSILTSTVLRWLSSKRVVSVQKVLGSVAKRASSSQAAGPESLLCDPWQVKILRRPADAMRLSSVMAASFSSSFVLPVIAHMLRSGGACHWTGSSLVEKIRKTVPFVTYNDQAPCCSIIAAA